MVFMYDIRLPGSELSSSICYMGLDKFENDRLIDTGVPTDIWFHVSDLSSAHVYLRLPSKTPALTMDDIPEDTLEDICQVGEGQGRVRPSPVLFLLSSLTTAVVVIAFFHSSS